MAIFDASTSTVAIKLNTPAIGMFNFWLGTPNVLDFGQITAFTPTVFAARDAATGYRVTWEGIGLSYAGGEPSGTIKAFSMVNSAGAPVYRFSGFELWITTDPDADLPVEEMMNIVLAGNDQIRGGSASDVLSGYAGNDSLFGGAGNDSLSGGAGNDTLDGSLGADQLVGGAGSDTYIVDNAGDRVLDLNAAAAEIDTVLAGVSWTLGVNVENLQLTGSAALNGTGNAAHNLITGNAAANTLSGDAGNDTLNGGAGNDLLIGGTGNDTYVVDAVGDRVTETSTLATEIDTVQAAVSYALGANVENLVLLGAAALNGTGNAANNVITGNAAANTLDGGAGNDVLIGGAGTDRLTGGIGNDVFRFAAWTDLGLGTARDVITDFTRGQDRIDLSLIDANAALAGDQAFSLVTTGFGTAAGQVRYAGGIVSINTDTDAAAEYEIQLIGTVPTALGATDFVL
ncbi:calcium-binding protein [Azohydromonas caseinilytica]|uniref:Calcium-binding protein n=1 Tax=Azohydromonas caseinilytica TaxID=2728836 RepID=A0A848FBY1_9BURK|nr:calcium-binding protein [Azohydromonas caseinilytica]NML15700.1 calcium-binding protein [Azohydromonas caseinilytica]